MSSSKSLIIPLNSTCGLRCVFCPFKDKHGQDELDYTNLASYRDLYFSGGYEDVIITDGEPLNHADIFSILTYILSFAKRLIIETNGEKFSEESFTNKCLEIFKGGNVHVKIPLYGSIPLIHEKITGGSYKKVIRGILLLQQGGFQNIGFHCLVLKQNYRDLSNIALVAEKLGLSVHFIYIIPDGHIPHQEILIPFSELSTISNIPIENIPVCIYPNGINNIKEEKGTIQDGEIINFSDDYLGIGNRLAKTYTEKCFSCQHKSQCEGIFLEYLETFGEKEFSILGNGKYFEIGKYKIETRNHGRPKCGSIKINENRHDDTESPRAWSQEIGGELIWYYNYYGAMLEAEYLGKRIPGINDWMKIFHDTGETMEIIRRKYNIPLSGFRNFQKGTIQKSETCAFLWSETIHDDEKNCFVSLRCDDAKSSRGWGEKELGMPLRFFHVSNNNS